MRGRASDGLRVCEGDVEGNEWGKYDMWQVSGG
jgi:hypothetical protein